MQYLNKVTMENAKINDTTISSKKNPNSKQVKSNRNSVKEVKTFRTDTLPSKEKHGQQMSPTNCSQQGQNHYQDIESQDATPMWIRRKCQTGNGRDKHSGSI